MKGPSLQKTTALSTAIHLTLLFFAVLIMRYPSSVVIPSPYVVSLVGSIGPETETQTSNTTESQQKETTLSASDAGLIQKKATKAELNRLNERISEIKSKKKIEKIVRLRTVVSIQNRGGQQNQKSAQQSSAVGNGTVKGTLFDSYYAKITDEIRREWAYPDSGERNLDAIIDVKIMIDGSITIKGVEKSSGNILFDRSALKAISKASPVSPPPYEMEIGMRFYP